MVTHGPAEVSLDTTVQEAQAQLDDPLVEQ